MVRLPQRWGILRTSAQRDGVGSPKLVRYRYPGPAVDVVAIGAAYGTSASVSGRVILIA